MSPVPCRSPHFPRLFELDRSWPGEQPEPGDPVPFSHPHFPTLIELSCIPELGTGLWRCLLKRGTICLGVGFGLIHFPFSSHAPVPKGTRVCLLNSEGSGQQRRTLLTKFRRKFFLTIIPSNLICKESVPKKEKEDKIQTLY